MSSKQALLINDGLFLNLPVSQSWYTKPVNVTNVWGVLDNINNVVG